MDCQVEGLGFMMMQNTICQSIVESSLKKRSHMGVGGDDADLTSLPL